MLVVDDTYQLKHIVQLGDFLVNVLLFVHQLDWDTIWEIPLRNYHCISPVIVQNKVLHRRMYTKYHSQLIDLFVSGSLVLNQYDVDEHNEKYPTISADEIHRKIMDWPFDQYVRFVLLLEQCMVRWAYVDEDLHVCTRKRHMNRWWRRRFSRFRVYFRMWFN